MQNLHWTIPPILEGHHVTLEPLQPHHADDLLAAASDGELWNLWFTQVPGPETVRAYLGQAIAEREAGTAMPFLVRDAHGEPVGSTRFFRMDPVVPSLEIGYTFYSARVQCTALNTEAKRLLLGHAFDAMGCSVVELRTHVMNHRSRAAILRLGAHFDGILRRNRRMPDGHLRDTAVYSILDSEWPMVRRGLDYKLEHGAAVAERISLGLVGARGYVGAELIKLVAAHPRFELAFVSSRERDGQRLAEHEPAYTGDLRYTNLGAADVAGQGVDALVLALPNGMAAGFVAALEVAGSDPVVVDLSADYRFDDGWHYGLPELTRGRAAGAHRISNPGCYATAMQLAVEPMREALAGPVQCFGVSGYSGAGTSPSDKNNPDKLRDNLMPYSLVDHVHEREVARQLGHTIEFMPHVAPHFRGITLTANLHLARAFTRDEIMKRYRAAYAGEPLVQVLDEAPWVSRIAGRHGAEVGGFTLSADGRRLVVVSTLDNLLKGAATQALQNLNLAFGLPETMGIPA